LHLAADAVGWQCACYRSLPTRCVQWWMRSAETARARHRATEYSGRFPDKYNGIARCQWLVAASRSSRASGRRYSSLRRASLDRATVISCRAVFRLTQVSPREGTATTGEEAGQKGKSRARARRGAPPPAARINAASD